MFNLHEKFLHKVFKHKTKWIIKMPFQHYFMVEIFIRINFFLQVEEKGNRFLTWNMKGMELQERKLISSYSQESCQIADLAPDWLDN